MIDFTVPHIIVTGGILSQLIAPMRDGHYLPIAGEYHSILSNPLDAPEFLPSGSCIDGGKFGPVANLTSRLAK